MTNQAIKSFGFCLRLARHHQMQLQNINPQQSVLPFLLLVGLLFLREHCLSTVLVCLREACGNTPAVYQTQFKLSKPLGCYLQSAVYY